VFQTIMSVLYSLISLYIFAITAYIILSWFSHGIANEAIVRARWFLARITDPYLNLFRRMRFLVIGGLDFSPMLGILLLIFIQDLLRQLSLGIFSLAGALFTLVSLIFNLATGILGLIAIVTIIRIVGLYVRANSISELWFRLDHFLQPVVLRFVKLIAPQSNIPYGSALGIFLAGCFISSLGIRLLLIPLQRLILMIPI
jgi:YggT family protein